MRTLLVAWGFLVPLAQADLRDHPQFKKWILDLQDGPEDKRFEAANALRAHGKKALPALAALREALAKAESMPTLESIVQTLGAIGPEARAAVPEIVKLVEKHTLRGEVAAQACISLGAPADAGLLQVCLQRGQKKGEEPSFDDDVPALIGAAPNDVIPALLTTATTAKPEMRVYILQCLFGGTVDLERSRRSNDARYDPERFAALKEKTREAMLAYARLFLIHEVPVHRHTASSLLLAISPDCVAEVFPIYFKALLIDDDIPRVVSREVLPASSVRWLLEYAGDRDEQTRKLARDKLKFMVRDDPLGCLRYFHTGLVHRDLRVVEATIDLLRLESEWAEELWPSLAALLDHPNAGIRFLAADCLIASDAPFSPRYLSVLREQLANPGNGEQFMALRLVGDLGRRGAVLTPEVQRLFKKDFVPRSAPHTLARIDPAAAATYLPVLKKELESSTAGPPHEILTTLTYAGPHAKSLLPMLRTTMAKTTATGTRWRIAEAIAYLDPANAADAVQVLKETVENAAANHIYEPLTAIRDLGAPGRVLVPWLLEQMRAETKSPQKSSFVAAVIVLDEAKAAEAIQVMRDGISGKEPSDWLDEAAALGRQGKQFVPDIIKQLKTKREDHIIYIKALSAFGSNAVDALPTLRALQKEPTLRSTATLAIRRIERCQGFRP